MLAIVIKSSGMSRILNNSICPYALAQLVARALPNGLQSPINVNIIYSGGPVQNNLAARVALGHLALVQVEQLEHRIVANPGGQHQLRGATVFHKRSLQTGQRWARRGAGNLSWPPSGGHDDGRQNWPRHRPLAISSARGQCSCSVT
jgi:hypothetical protein